MSILQKLQGVSVSTCFERETYLGNERVTSAFLRTGDKVVRLPIVRQGLGIIWMRR